MEFLKEFGLNPVLLFAQIVNFLIVFYILKRFLYKPILTTLKDRELSIKKGIEQSEEARVLLEETKEKEKEILKKAQAETRKLLTDAKKQTVILMHDAEKAANVQTEKILKEAKSQIEQETKEAEKRLAKHVSFLAASFLQESVSDLFTDANQEDVMKNVVKKLKSRTN